MGSVAIIPARGGSKRIPRKNIKTFVDKPIIALAIEKALASKLFDRVIVSTEDEEIAAVAKEYGAEVPFLRSKSTASDTATTAEVIHEVLADLKSEGQEYDFACCIYPTSPLLRIEALVEGHERLRTEGYDSVIPVVAFSYPIQRSLKLESDKMKVSFNWPEHETARSQDLEKAYHDAGQFYWLNVNAFNREQKLFTSNTGAIVLNEIEVQDIDSEVDWKLAILKYEYLQGT